MSNKLCGVVAIIFTLLVAAGCAEIRKVTYPPEFTYIEKQDLQGAMGRMAASLAQLDSLIASGSPQGSILEQLNAIDRVASDLSRGQATNHLLLDEHMEQFRADVAKAKLMASMSSPNYYYAGRLSGSCSGCHQFR